MQSKFIVSHAGLELGPYSADEIKGMLKKDQLLPVDYYYDESRQDWILLNERFEQSSSEGVTSITLDLDDDDSQGIESITVVRPSPAAEKENSDNPPPPTQVMTKKTSPLKVAAMSPTPAVKPTSTAPIVVATPAAMTLTAKHKPAEAPIRAPTEGIAPINSQRLTFQGGVGTFNLKQLKAGQVIVKLQDCNNPDVKLPEAVVVDVQSGPAKTFTMHMPEKCTAGTETIIKVIARDSFDNIAHNFQGRFDLQVKGNATSTYHADLTKGIAEIKFRWTVAEPLQLEITTNKSNGLAMPAPQTLHVQAGPAVQLMVETPKNAAAGEQVPVTVKAVDEWGNLATDFSGEIGVDMQLKAG